MSVYPNAIKPRARGTSKQDWRTPPAFIAAVERRFGLVALDLAAKDGDECKPLVDHITPEQDSLADATEWPTRRHSHGVYFLNPPFADIAPWASKCDAWRSAAQPGAVLALLVPASVDAEWWRDHVRGQAIVYALKSRITFIGAEDGYPKPLVLCVYDPRHFPTSASVELWDWRTEIGT